MGVSTDAQLSYGIDFGEEPEFPWMDDKYEDDIEEWWMDVNNFICSVESPYDNDSATGYKDGYDGQSPEVSMYHKARLEWKDKNPVPIDVVYYCSHDYPMYLLAVKGYDSHVARGYCEEVDTNPVPTAYADRFMAFLKEHGIETDERPRWLMTSMWG